MKTNDDLMQMILISLLKLTIENDNKLIYPKGCKGLTAECEYNGIRYKLVFAPADDFRMISNGGESDEL